MHFITHIDPIRVGYLDWNHNGGTNGVRISGKWLHLPMTGLI